MIMQAALSSVNFGLNSKPSLEKNSIDFFRSRTARLTKSLREPAMCPPWMRPGLGPPGAVKIIGRRLRREGSGQAEQREQPLGVEERVPARDALARQLEDDERPR